MKIFSRGNEAKPPAEQSPAATALTGLLPVGPAASVATTPPTATPAAAPAPAPAAPPAPDLSAVLDANVKEMSEKIARLTSTIESQIQEKAQMEDKLGAMEERMRKLSSLTEMMSAQYNPFVGDAPTERMPMPAPEVGLAPPSLPAPSDLGALAPSLGLDALTPVAAPPEPAPLAEPMQAPPMPLAPPMAELAPEPEPAAPLARLWDVPHGFESSLLMLGWADMLLKSTGSRESLHELVAYYHNIGWLGDPARDQLLGYADGIALAPDAPARPDWRTAVDVHERSLLFIEKLRAVRRAA